MKNVQVHNNYYVVTSMTISYFGFMIFLITYYKYFYKVE